ncbi:hypothetical protein BVC80_1721g28 [Macleaya cordata]|uniref:Zinc finger protein n=1 Tax=Macleaya cordata TaxID=56857 RepID=A0A200QCI0_MACCD|nr:hypothetical protein BVC80_1721g28 [Macleaya cordata]
MGGGSCSTEVTIEETTVDCQMCGLDGHTCIECPWVYTRCRKPGCNGSRKLLCSTQPNSVGRRFLTCQKSTCKQFQWLEKALSLVVSSPPQSYYVDGCFGCGDTNH